MSDVSPEVAGLDLPAVTSWLQATSPGLLTAPLQAQLIAGGRSNLTYLLAGADAGDPAVVLRRPPLGHVLATAHDMAREARVLRALAGHSVPVPQVLAECREVAVTGAPFYLMSYVEGRVLRRRSDLPGLGLADRADRADLARAMVEVLADLHGLDVDTLGLGDWARPEAFLSRQLRRWTAQLAASRSRELAGLEHLQRSLSATMPSSGRICLVHGDYRLDNLVLAPHRPWSVRAVLDWEMATVGDPLADLGLLLAYWDGLGSMPDAGFQVIGPAADFPDGDQLATWYRARSSAAGTQSPAGTESLGWYRAFGYFKIAAIFEGIHHRHATGGTVGAGFDAFGPLVPVMIEHGLAALASPA